MFQVAAVYAGVAWLLAQSGVILFDTYATLSWVQPVFIGVLILGFPAAVILAWGFEKSPEADQRWRVARTAGAVIAAGAIVAVGYFLYVSDLVLPSDITDRRLAEVGAALLDHDPAKSIAVLPLANLSPDPDNAYFAAGVHEEILNQLTQIGELTVIARTSVLRYADTTESMPVIARELGVATVMEGSVRYAGNRVRITAQLIDGASGAHLWSEVYDRDLADIFAIQSEIAQLIAASLRVELSVSEQEGIETALTDNMAAYESYLQARMTGIDVESRLQQRSLLEQAIALDPEFAQAHLDLALWYQLVITSEEYADGMYPEFGPDPHLAARRHAGRALEIDPTLGVAHIVLALVYRYEWKWDDAGREYETAFVLSPSDPQVLIAYSAYSGLQRNSDISIAAARRLVELVPNNARTTLRLGLGLMFARRLDEARSTMETAIELDPADPIPSVWLPVVLAFQGDEAGALRQLELAEAALDEAFGEQVHPIWIGHVAGVYAWLGMTEEVERLFRRLEVIDVERRVSTWNWARMHMYLGNVEQGLDLMHQAIDSHDNSGGVFAWFGHRENLLYDDSLWDYPRFQEVRVKLGFAE